MDEQKKQDHLNKQHKNAFVDDCVLCDNLKNNPNGGSDIGVDVNDGIKQKDQVV